MPNSICNICKQQVDTFISFKESIIHNEMLLEEAYKLQNKVKEEVPLVDFLCEINQLNICEKEIEDSVKEKISSLNFLGDQEEIIKQSDKPVKKKIQRKRTTVKCETCNKKISQENVVDHKVKCNIIQNKQEEVVCEQKPSTCNICFRIFSSEVRLALHYIQHVMYDSDVKMDIFLFCNYCGIIFNTNEEYIQHLKETHNEIDDWICKVCNLKFETEFLLIQHLHSSASCEMISMNFKNDVCMLCQKVVKESLAGHVKQHLLKRYSCKFCNEKYITSIGYNAHLKNHPQYNNKNKCEYCNNMFISKRNLSKHIKEIHNSDQFVCEICSKVFNRKHNLSLHMRQKHDDKTRNFICSVCAFATKSNSELRKHERLHSNERPYKCTFENCNKTFKTSSHLNLHIKIHLNIRNFVCEFCDKSFYTSKNLKHHILVHTGVKDFKCNLCESEFMRRDQLTSHMRRRHGCLEYSFKGN